MKFAITIGTQQIALAGFLKGREHRLQMQPICFVTGTSHFFRRFSFVMKLTSSETAVVSTFATLYPAMYAGISNLQVYAGSTRARTMWWSPSACIAGCMTEKGTTPTTISRMRCHARRGPTIPASGLAEKSSGFLLQNNIFGRLDERMPDRSTISRTR
jgi:hypothetical protein